MSDERRRNRSNDPNEAAALYLATAVRRGGVEAVALSDEDGFLVAGAGEEYDLDWLAALGSAYAGRADEHGSLEELGGGLHAETVHVGARTLYLARVGGGGPRAAEAGVALGRILTQAAA